MQSIFGHRSWQGKNERPGGGGRTLDEGASGGRGRGGEGRCYSAPMTQQLVVLAASAVTVVWRVAYARKGEHRGRMRGGAGERRGLQVALILPPHVTACYYLCVCVSMMGALPTFTPGSVSSLLYKCAGWSRVTCTTPVYLPPHPYHHTSACLPNLRHSRFCRHHSLPLGPAI